MIVVLESVGGIEITRFHPGLLLLGSRKNFLFSRLFIFSLFFFFLAFILVIKQCVNGFVKCMLLSCCCFDWQVLVEDEKAVGVRLKRRGGGGKRGGVIRARRAVVMNADRWAAAKLLPEGTIPVEKRYVPHHTGR